MTAAPPAAGWSLRTRLTGLIVALALLAWAASSAWLYRSALAESDRLSDAALVETAHAVLAVADHELRKRPHRGDDGAAADDDAHDGRLELARIGHAHDEHLYYQVRGPDGSIVYRSPGAPQAPLAAADAAGFVQGEADGRRYRVYALRAEHDRRVAGSAIHVAQPLDDRAAMARRVALRLVAPGIGLALLLALGTHIVVRRVTAPVVHYARALDALDPASNPASATAPAPPHQGLPRELHSIGVAVDRLLARVEAALRHERTLTADAAHELRTPLAALRAQAQVAARARDAAERDEALQALQAGVDRATALVSAMLTLARLDAAEFDVRTLPSVDLAGLATHAVDALRPAAQARGVELVSAVQPCAIRGEADALAALLRNLLDNALRHARSHVALAVEADAGQARVVVADDGPGLTQDQAARVFDRFYRAGASGSGTGLGLAIVQRVVQLHGGAIHVGRSARGGAAFTVTLPRAGQA